MDPEALERRLDLLQHRRDRVALHARKLDDVLAAVAVFGRLLPAPDRVDREAEALDLGAGVVVVVLALDLVAREREQAREGIADRTVARRRDRERAGRVGGDHLDLHALPRVCPAGTVVGAGLEDLAEDLAEPGRSQPEVDEAGAGDLGALDLRKTGRRNHQLLGQLARRLPARGRELQRDVGGVVAVRRVARALQLDRSPSELGEPSLQAVDGLRQWLRRGRTAPRPRASRRARAWCRRCRRPSAAR